MGRYNEGTGEKIKKNTWKMAITVVCLILLLLLCVYGVACYILEDQVIWSDNVINGVSIKGLTKEDALQKLQEKFEEEYGDSEIKISIGDQENVIEIFPMLEFSAEDLVEESYKLGHGAWYMRGLEWWENYQNPKTEEFSRLPVYDVEKNEKTVEDMISDLKLDQIDTHVEMSWEWQEDALFIHKGKAGITADVEKLKEEVDQLLAEGTYTAKIQCPEIEIKPGAPDFEKLAEEVYVQAQDAYLDEKFEVIPEVEGTALNVEEAQKLFEEAKEDSDLTIPLELIAPEVTSEEAKAVLFRDVLGEYTTYASGTSARLNNIQLAANACNGVVLYPEEVFSYNQVVGERTAERGYQAAGVFINGQLAQGVGGGICQLSSTMHAATLSAGLHILERHPHSQPVSYIPTGMDATVSWGLLDFVYQNNTEYPIKLEVLLNGAELMVRFWGTKTTI